MYRLNRPRRERARWATVARIIEGECDSGDGYERRFDVESERENEN